MSQKNEIADLFDMLLSYNGCVAFYRVPRPKQSAGGLLTVGVWRLNALEMDEHKIIKPSEDQDINQDQEKDEDENPGQEQHSSYHYPVVLDTSRQAASFLNIEDMLFEVRTVFHWTLHC